MLRNVVGGGGEAEGGGGGGTEHGTSQHDSTGAALPPTTLAAPPTAPHYPHQPSLDYSLTGRRDVYSHMLPSSHLQGNNNQMIIFFQFQREPIEILVQNLR